MQSTRRVNVVVTCTDRKSIAATDGLKLRFVPHERTADRLTDWIARLTAAQPDGAARDLYAGEHWTVSNSIGHTTSDRWQIRLWIISAGYGLIPSDAQIASYGAAFSNGKPDAVVPKPLRHMAGQIVSEWWSGLGRWEGPAMGSPRSLESLAASDPSAVLLVSCSGTYLRAVREDVHRAAVRTANLFIVSAGTNSLHLAPWLVPADGRARSSLGGSMMSLNARISRHLMSSADAHEFDRPTVAASMRSLLEQGYSEVYNRKPMTDTEVERFVLDTVRSRPNQRVAKTPLLRALRDSGFACEQRRFGRLFDRIIEDAQGLTSEESNNG